MRIEAIKFQIKMERGMMKHHVQSRFSAYFIFSLHDKFVVYKAIHIQNNTSIMNLDVYPFDIVVLYRVCIFFFATCLAFIRYICGQRQARKVKKFLRKADVTN